MSSCELATFPSGEGDPAPAAVSSPKLNALRAEHDDLESAIGILLEARAYVDHVVARFKNRKLQIKDEIANDLAAGHGMPDHFVHTYDHTKEAIKLSESIGISQNFGTSQSGALREPDNSRPAPGNSFWEFVAFLAIVFVLCTCWPTLLYLADSFGD